MFYPRKGPGGRVNENVRSMLQRKRPAELGKSEIVANAQGEIELADLATNKRVTGREVRAFVERSSCNQMSFSIFRENLPVRVDKYLGIVNARSVAIRNAGHDRDRKILCRFL